MAVIVPSNPYEGLIRKVGYSVGLEFIVDRTRALVELYARDRTVSVASWQKLVAEVTGRKEWKTAAIHIADFFGRINLLRISNRQAVPLHGLETLSIVWRHLRGPVERERAIEFVLSTYVIEADGDVFLNLLSGSFEEESGRRAIQRMVVRKRELLANSIPHPALQKKIFDIVTIKTQAQPKRERGSSGQDRVSPFAKRTTPLSDARRIEPLSGGEDSGVTVSDDYMRKVIQTRRGWARDLQLFGGTSLTDGGTRLLDGMRLLGLAGQGDVFLFWPYERDLRAIHLDPSALNAPPLSEWDLLAAVAKSRYELSLDTPDSDSAERLLGLLRRFQLLYRQGHRARGSIRHVLPLYIAQPAVAATCVATGEPLLQVPTLLRDLLRSPERKIDFGNIRGTEGGISVRP